jgi:ABC-type glycerol-3-phosphate transport system substrate-binding protein
MGIELYWDNDEQTVILVEMQGKWTWDEMYEALQKVKRITDRSPVVLGAILDLTHGASFPGGSPFNATTYGHGQRVLKMGEGGTGPIAVVGANPFFRKVFEVFLSMDRDKLAHIRFVDTLEEAGAFMATQDFRPKQPVV